MKAWDIKIRATVEKTIRVTEEDGVENGEEATELAHTLFTVKPMPNTPEKYEQDTVGVFQVEI